MNIQSPESKQISVERDRLLVEQALGGDQHSFSQLFFNHKEMVHRVIYRFLGACEEADDAVQQTFVELFKSLSNYEGKSKFTTWLYRIAINVSIQFLRKRHSGIKADRLDPDFLPDSGNNELVEKEELRKQISIALSSMEIRKRVVVILHDIEGRTMEEISEIIKVPLGTVKSRLFHGRDELRKKLKKVMNQV